MQMVFVPVAIGELVDKLTILRIKSERIVDRQKLENIRKELDELEKSGAGAFPATKEFEGLVAKLKAVNEEIWDLEDDIRDCERKKSFDDRFITLARLVYKTNDRRAALKRELNMLAGSTLVEEKSYAAY